MKKIRPFSVVFLVVQGILFGAVLVIPGYVSSLLSQDLDGLFWLALFLIASFGVLLIDAVWVAEVLRRYHARHREVSPIRALLAWGIYLSLATVAAPCVNLVVLAREVPPLTLYQWGVFFSLYLIPALIPATILWIPAFLLSILDPNYRYTPKKSKPQA